MKELLRAHLSALIEFGGLGYDEQKENHLSEDGVLNVDLEVLKMVAKDYVKHVQHFLNVC